MFLCCLLLSIALCCSAEDHQNDHHSHQPVAMTMGSTDTVHADVAPAGPSTSQTVQTPPPCLCPAPNQSALVQEQQQEAQWRQEVLALLSQVVAAQKEVAGGQVEVVKLLGTLGSQGSQQILDLQNMARHQSLLVENNQALLLQTSRIATHLQDTTKRPDNQ